MALTRITKGVIKPNENYDTHNIVSTGIVTSVGLDVNGNGDISGNLSVGGVLTYEDVTSIDSVGIITAQKDIHVGAGVSAVGVGTFGGLDINGDIDVDGHTNLDNVSIAGVTTFTGAITANGAIDLNADLDVDGHTNLDNVSIAGVTTATGNITILSAHPKLLLTDDTNPDFSVHVNGGSFHIRNETVNRNDFRITSDGTVELYYAPGYKKLMSWTDAPIMPTPGAVGSLIEMIAEKENITVVGVDIGGATTDIFSVFQGKFNRTVSANLGMSYSICNVLAESGLDNVLRWVPFDIDRKELTNRIGNKMIRPTTVPQSLEELFIEQAIAREALRLSFKQHKEFAVGLKGIQKERTISDAFDQSSSGGVDVQRA